MPSNKADTVRRSVALPRQLVDEVLALAEMASDPAIRKESAAIAAEFACAEMDGLGHD